MLEILLYYRIRLIPKKLIINDSSCFDFTLSSEVTVFDIDLVEVLGIETVLAQGPGA